MWGSKVKALPLPPVAEREGGKEILRAVIVNGDLHISLVRGFDHASVWGILLVDVARHASRIFARETNLSEDEAMARITDMFQAEIDRPTDTGTTESIQ